MSFWLSRDPIGEKGGLNIYRIADNNPISQVDSLGLQGCSGCASKKNDCCCCCVEGIHVLIILNDQPLTWVPSSWWEFFGSGSGSWKEGVYKYENTIQPKLANKIASKPVQNKECTLKWTEKNYEDSTFSMIGGRTYGGLGIDIIAPGKSKTYDSWPGWKTPSECPGTLDPILESPHGFRSYGVDKTGVSHLETEATFFSSTDPQCKGVCTYTKIRVKITTKLRLKAGKPDRNFESFTLELESL